MFISVYNVNFVSEIHSVSNIQSQEAVCKVHVTLIVKSPSCNSVSISETILTHSASGIIGSYCPAMSMSC